MTQNDERIGFQTCWWCKHLYLDIAPPKHFTCSLHEKTVSQNGTPCDDFDPSEGIAGSVTKTYQRKLNKTRK